MDGELLDDIAAARDIALMPINGRLPERRVTGNFWGREAAGFARAIGAVIRAIIAAPFLGIADPKNGQNRASSCASVYSHRT